MDKKFIKFDETEIENCMNVKAILINNIDINKIVVFNKVLFSKQDFTHFIG